MNKEWTAQEIALLRAVYTAHDGREASRQTGRSLQAVYTKARELGLQKRKVTSVAGKAWTGAEDELLRTLYPTSGLKEAASALARGEGAVYCRAKKLGLFTPIPRGDRIKHPIGAQRLRRGLCYQKVADTGDEKTDWKRLDVVEWERANGSVPAGFVLVLPRGALRAGSSLVLVSAEKALHLIASEASGKRLPEVRELHALKAKFGQRLYMVKKRHGVTKSAKRQRTPWSDDELAYLHEHCGNKSVPAMAAHLGRTHTDVQTQMLALYPGSTAARPTNCRSHQRGTV